MDGQLKREVRWLFLEKVIAPACFSVKTLTDGRGSLFSPPFFGDQVVFRQSPDPQVNWLQAETKNHLNEVLYKIFCSMEKYS